MDYGTGLAMTLNSLGFTKIEDEEVFIGGKYKVEFKEKYFMTVRYKYKAKKNEKEEMIAWVIVFSGMIRSASALEIIIKSVCYDRKDIR